MSTMNEPGVDLRTAQTTEFPTHQEVRAEDPKRNPVTYAALAIALLALLLSIAALSRGGDDGFKHVQVGDKRCIVDRIDGSDVDTLFCQQ